MADVWIALDFLAGREGPCVHSGTVDFDVRDWLKNFGPKNLIGHLNGGGSGSGNCGGVNATGLGQMFAQYDEAACFRPNVRPDSVDDAKAANAKGVTTGRDVQRKAQRVAATKIFCKWRCENQQLDEVLDQTGAHFVALSCVGCDGECRFNLPRVSAKLEKLVGTNVVNLTDRKYMQDLRSKIIDEYHNAMFKRISKREAREMERQRELIIKGKVERCPQELANHPVFMANQRTNKVIAKRRRKMRTTRERDSENLVRQGAQWEKQRLHYDELERQQTVDAKAKQDERETLEREFTAGNRSRGLDLLRIDNRNFGDTELELLNFLEDEKAKMVRGYKPTKAIQFATGQHALSEGQPNSLAHPTLSQAASSQRSKFSLQLDQETSESKQDPDFELQVILAPQTSSFRDEDEPSTDRSASEVDSVKEAETDRQHTDMLQTSIEHDKNTGYMMDDENFGRHKFTDPLIAKLKNSDTVKDLYFLADEILGGVGKKTNKEQQQPNEN